ncbi:MAG: hypothetical protein ACKVVP_03320 [Chloroflexota bacterium]
MAVGTAVLNFGAWPGASMASTVVLGQVVIEATSQVSAAVSLSLATADHSIEEHRVEPLKITAGAIVAGTGFTIYGECLNSLTYGEYTIDWVWA